MGLNEAEITRGAAATAEAAARRAKDVRIEGMVKNTEL